MRCAGAFCAAVFVLALSVADDSRAAELRRNRLPVAWKNPQAVLSVVFVRGMTCRACTMILDRHLNGTIGVYWARFNFPLRLLVVYHDPGVVPLDTITALVDGAGELRAVKMRSEPAGRFVPGKNTPIASWKGGPLSREEAGAAIRRFEGPLRKLDIEKGGEEWDQFTYEILGEEVRTRIFKARAAAAGFRAGPPGTTLPMVIPREFYWPSDALDPSPEEAGIARFIRDKVLLGDEEEKGRARFDDWLLALWREIGLDFRGDVWESKP